MAKRFKWRLSFSAIAELEPGALRPASEMSDIGFCLLSLSCTWTVDISF